MRTARSATTVPDWPPASLVLLLSARCNLSCSYCFQDHRQGPARMSWGTARTALELLCSGAGDTIAVEFAGGEPLLEQTTLRRAVEFLDAHRAQGVDLEYSLTTNGTLLDDPLFGFLSHHGFTVRISFDGLPPSQRERGEGTFDLLDRLLTRLRDTHPEAFAKHVRVVVTLLAGTIPHLAETVEYLLGKGVQTIEIGPRFTWDPEWRASCRAELERQIEKVVGQCVAHWRRTGAVPVGFLAGPPLPARHRTPEFLCRAPEGMNLTVDPAGRVWACPLFMPSLVPLTPLALEASQVLDLGRITDASFRRRLAELPERLATLRLFVNRGGKRSSYGTCAECRFVASCRVCPASISHSPFSRDPDLIPDFMCAFKFLTLAAREQFDLLTGGRFSTAWRRELKSAFGNVETAVRRSVAGIQRDGSAHGARSRRGSIQDGT